MTAIKLFRPKVLIGTFLTLGLFMLFYFNYVSMLETSSDEDRPKPKQSFLNFKGFTMVDSTSDRVIRVEADELVVRPKKYYVFALKPFDEIVLKNSKITVSENAQRLEGSFSKESKSVPFPKFELALNPFNHNSANVISGVRLNGFIYDIIQGENAIFKCSAKQAYIDIGKSEIDFEELEIFNFESNKKIVAKKGRLDIETSAIKIPTSQIREAKGVPVDGKLICLDMSLNALKPSIVDKVQDEPAKQLKMN